MSGHIQELNFRFTIKNVMQLTTTSSSQVYVNCVPWQVKLKKSGKDIFVMLCCNNSDKSWNWSCAARAIFKLLSFGYSSEVFEKCQDVVGVFSSRILNIRRNDALVEWQDLFDPIKRYVRNNTMMVDVTIQADKLRNKVQSRLIKVNGICGHAAFRFKVINVNTIIAVTSPEFNYRNMKCELTISKRYPLTNYELTKSKLGYLGISLVPKDGSYIEEPYTVKVIFRLLSHKLGGKHFEKLAENVEPNRFNYISRLICLTELYENPNEYVFNDSVSVEVYIRIENKEVSCHDGVSKSSSITMECVLCFDNMMDRPISSTPCGHLFCRLCIEKSLLGRARCPICNNTVSREQLHDIFLPSIKQSE